MQISTGAGFVLHFFLTVHPDVADMLAPVYLQCVLICFNHCGPLYCISFVYAHVDIYICVYMNVCVVFVFKHVEHVYLSTLLSS